MTCHDAEKALLLADSGELSPRRRRVLEAHLTACPSCREFRLDMAATQRAFLAGERKLSPPDWVATRILAEARAVAGRRETERGLPWVGWRSGLAAAAALAILAGLAGLMWPSQPRKPEADRIAQLSTLLALAGSEATSAEALAAADTEDHDHEQRVQSLAASLLAIQGLGGNLTELESASLDEEPPAIDPLSHSSPAFPGQGCV